MDCDNAIIMAVSGGGRLFGGTVPGMFIEESYSGRGRGEHTADGGRG